MEHNALARQFGAGSLLRFALPNIIMMVFLSLYTIVDGMFVSRLVGTLALSALNMSWPLFCLELGLSIMLASGGSAVIARKMGEGKAQEAREDFTFFIFAALVMGVLCTVICLVFLDPILLALGTSPAQMPDCTLYTAIILLFSPAYFLQCVFQTFFVTAGHPTLGLGVTVAGGMANIILDYLFMGPMGMGVEGAAIATGIGYLIPTAAGFFYFMRVRTGSLYLVRFRPRWPMLLRACGNGASEMVTNVANAVTTFLFNVIFLYYWAEDGVAAITIVMYFQFVYSSAFFGFSMGVAPVISYKYGAEDYAQLRHIVGICIRFILLCSLAMYALSRLTIGFSLGVFTERGGNVFRIAMDGFPVYALSFLLMGVSIFASAMFTAFSNGRVSAIISFARTFVFLVGMMLLLPYLLAQEGIWLAVPTAELLGLLVSVSFLLWGRGRYHY